MLTRKNGVTLQELLFVVLVVFILIAGMASAVSSCQGHTTVTGDTITATRPISPFAFSQASAIQQVVDDWLADNPGYELISVTKSEGAGRMQVLIVARRRK